MLTKKLDNYILICISKNKYQYKSKYANESEFEKKMWWGVLQTLTSFLTRLIDCKKWAVI